MELLDDTFFQVAAAAYDDLARQAPQRIVTLDARLGRDALLAAALDALGDLLGPSS